MNHVHCCRTDVGITQKVQPHRSLQEYDYNWGIKLLHEFHSDEMHYRYSPLIKESLLSGVSVFQSHDFADSLCAVQEIGWH